MVSCFLLFLIYPEESLSLSHHVGRVKKRGSDWLQMAWIQNMNHPSPYAMHIQGKAIVW